MVNLDKWEEVEFDDLKLGDKVKRITLNEDGTKAVITGKIKYRDGDMFLSENRFKLVDIVYFHKIYRRKPKPFELPTNLFAVVEGTYRWAQTSKPDKFTLLTTGWYTENGTRAFPDALIANYVDHKIIFEGV